jgi:peptidoglycan-associated lipoprotein
MWFATVLALFLMVSACSRNPPPAAAPPPPPPPPATTPPPPPPPPPPPAPTPPPPPAPLTEEQIFAQKTVDQLNAERPLADVFFALDSSDLSEEARSALERNATYLKRWPSVRLTVEGHCDSRGSSEYNLALGERRANSVRSYLSSLGVTGDRILSVSKGKEEPLCREENESCWQQNRRGHSIITAK